MAECWCVKYHTYRLGTRLLTECECSCHETIEKPDERIVIEGSRGITQYVEPFRHNTRLDEARRNLERRGFIFPPDESYLRTYELYVDEFPERWYVSDE